MTKIGLHDIANSTTPESNKSLDAMPHARAAVGKSTNTAVRINPWRNPMMFSGAGCERQMTN